MFPTEDERWVAACAICARLRARGHRALLAGGCVRDILLGRVPKDYDIATSARPEEVAALLDPVKEVGASFAVQRLSLPEGAFEIATFRKDGPYADGRRPVSIEYADETADARRRDFTINAMFLDPADGRIIDHVGGREDLAARLIRTVGPPRARFEEDHLRLLRAVRFAARLSFEIEPATFRAIQTMAPLVARTSPERIRDELVMCFTQGAAGEALRLLDRTGLLGEILPEVLRMKGVEQPPQFHPEGDVFAHTVVMLDAMEHPSPALALAVLLHDIGKPLTQTFEDRIRFNHHDKVGAHVAREICHRLRFSTEGADRIAWLVGRHMRLIHAREMRKSRLTRLVRHPGFPELLELCRLDALASHSGLELVDWVAGYARGLGPDELRPLPLLNGHDLISMGYDPGPRFQEMLQALEDAQLEGQLSSPEEARLFLQAHWALDHPQEKKQGDAP